MLTLRVQVLNYHILSQIVNLHNYYPKPEYLVIGSFGPSGLRVIGRSGRGSHVGLPGVRATASDIWALFGALFQRVFRFRAPLRVPLRIPLGTYKGSIGGLGLRAWGLGF